MVKQAALKLLGHPSFTDYGQGNRWSFQNVITAIDSQDIRTYVTNFVILFFLDFEYLINING